MKRKLGVIGGLGTDTAAQFYVECERLWSKSGQSSHIPLMLENIQSSFSLEQSLVTELSRADELREFLCQAAMQLEAGGASLIVLPCNTAHIHIDAIRSAIKTPMLSITEEVAKKLKSLEKKDTAILGTRITRESGIYNAACHRLGIKARLPSEVDQLAIERIIQRALSWKNDASDTEVLLTVIQQVKKEGADSVVLACTDLQLCMPTESITDVLDSMKTLAEASVFELINQK
jgi:aspartate racemase